MKKTKISEEKTEILLDLTNWSITTKERSRDRMKLQIKLNKTEAQSLKNFTTIVKPDEVSEADFLKSVFKIGLEEMEIRLMNAVEKHAEENDIDLDALKNDPNEETVLEAITDESKDEE